VNIFTGGSIKPRGGGKWTFLNVYITPREFEQDVDIRGRSVTVTCREAGRLVKTLSFDLYDWPQAPDRQIAFLEYHHPYALLEARAGSRSAADFILFAQARAVNAAREKLARAWGMF
jgi:hypothetical protein